MSIKKLIYILNHTSCNYCQYFDEKCIHETAIENEKDKIFMVEYHNKIGKPFNIEFAKNIDNRFACDNFKDKKL